MVSLLCLCSDKLLEAVPTFCLRLRKYWPEHPPLLIAGYSKPEIPIANAEFLSIGKFEDYPVERWSEGLLHAMDFVEDTFILFLEDYWLTHSVDSAAITTLRGLIVSSDNILKIDLHGDRMRHAIPAAWERFDGIPLVRSAPHSPYQMSFMAGWWKKDLLTKILESNLGKTPWELELQPGLIPSNMEVYGTLGIPPIRYEVAYRNGKKVA